MEIKSKMGGILFRFLRLVLVALGAGDVTAETLRGMKPDAQVLVPEYQQTLEI